jgi:hypothetical protein
MADLSMEEFMGMVEKASKEGYSKGRAEAEEERAEKWLPPVDSKLVAKAKALEYISLAEIKAARRLGSKKKHEVDLPVGESNTKLKLVLDEDEQESIKWLEWLSLFADLVDLYCIHGEHPEKLGEMLTHYRLMQRFGSDHTFTYESLMEYDTHIRSRKEGQGPNLSWRFDTTTRHVILKDYVPKEKKKPKGTGKGKIARGNMF